MHWQRHCPGRLQIGIHLLLLPTCEINTVWQVAKLVAL